MQILAKSKKAKEVEVLMQENDSLQRKLGSQEEDFRLQNETIMKELAQVRRSLTCSIVMIIIIVFVVGRFP